MSAEPAREPSYFALRERIRAKLADKLDLSKATDLSSDVLRREVRLVVARLCETEKARLDPVTFDLLATQVLDFVLAGRPERPNE